MNKFTSVLVIIPLVAGFAGPAIASIAESGEVQGLSIAPGALDSLINRYSGLIPGDSESAAVSHSVTANQMLSSFTRAVATMSSGYTARGSERIITQSNYDVGTNGIASNGDAAAPSVATITVAHYAPDSLVSAVSEGITPSSSGTSSSSSAISALQISNTSSGTFGYNTTITGPPTTITYTTTITGTNPVPVPPACFLFGSGLSFLAALRYRLRAAV